MTVQENHTDLGPYMSFVRYPAQDRLEKTIEIFLLIATVLEIHLAEYGVFIVELICTSQREEKLTAVIMWASVRHGNQTSPIEAQSGVKFILKSIAW